MTNRVASLLLNLFIFLTVAAGSASAQSYYINGQNGSDGNAGTSIDKPWKSIGKANSSLRAGDVVYIRAGTYNAGINPSSSGSSGNTITYRNYNNETVHINATCFIRQNYIVVQGVNIKPQNPPTKFSYILTIDGNHNLIKNVKIINKADPWDQRLSRGIKESGIVIRGGDDNIVDGCEIRNLSDHGITSNIAGTSNVAYRNKIINSTSYGHYGNAITVGHSNDRIAGLLIFNNYLGGSLVSDGVQCNGNFTSGNFKNRGVIIKDNTIVNNAENGIDLKGTRYFVIEGNTIYGSRGDNNGEQDCYSNCDGKSDRNGGMGGITRGTNQPSADIIIRHNKVYDNKGGLHLFGGFRVYNNVISSNNRDYTGPNSSYNGSSTTFPGIWSSSSNLGIRNNVIGGNKSGDVVLMLGTVDIDYNMYFSSNANLAHFEGGGQPSYVSSFDDWRSTLRADSSISGKDANSFVGSSIKSGISGAAGHLVTTRSGGSGTVIPVSDALYFNDGFNVTQGDTIRVGSETVRVRSVDYGGNRLTVDRSISWQNNTKVYFCKDGKFSADIGAAEGGSVAPLIPGDEQLSAPTLKIVAN